MPVNDLTFNQLSTVLASITRQATGQTVLAPTDTSSFVSVANTALKTGYDPVLQAISQVLSRTIFSIRPYTRKFGGLMVTNQQYGNIVRKLSPVDKPFEDDARFDLTDGESVDQYTVNKPGVLQTNFYGANVYQKSLTIFRDQLDCAFSSPDEFARFISMATGNASDMIEQAHETTARATIANLIGAIVGNYTAGKQIVHLLTEYNTATGLALTAESVYQPENFKPFMQWVYSRIASISSLLTERTTAFHANITGKEVVRHTPFIRQRAYLYAPARYQVEAQVLADTYHDNYLRLADNETVNFWQALASPDSIKITPAYLDTTTGAVATGAAVEQGNIFGVIMDEEAAGYTVVNQWSASTPFNAKGGYSNIFWHFTDRYWNDFTENAVVLLLD